MSIEGPGLPRRLARSCASAMVALSLGFCPPVLAQSTPLVCDSTLRQLAPNSESGYQLRGDRCEGLHGLQVVGPATLALISITQLDTPSIAGASNIHLAWSGVEKGNVVVRARSTRRHVTYTMNTLRPAQSHDYIWDLEWVRGVRLGPVNFGFLAWLDEPKTYDRVYVPLLITTSGRPSRQGEYTVVVVPTADLTALSASIGELKADGTVGSWPVPDHEVGRSVYRRDTPVGISLPRSKAKLLRISLNGQTANGILVTREFVVQNPSP